MTESAVIPQIDQVEILELLGSGGMSLVYKARQKNLDRVVAVKVLTKQTIKGELALQRFHQEARLSASLDHPNITKTIAYGVSNDGQPYMIMEFLLGKTLKEYLNTEKMPLGKFRDVFLPILSALDTAHRAGLIHRDIKPENIMLCKEAGGKELVKLLDFGIAKLMESEAGAQSLTSTGTLLGSPSYMSPEQCSGKKLDQRSDIYSISCVMYEALCGEAPFSADSALEIMHKHATEPPPTVSELSRKIDIRKELAELTLAGLAKDPAQRPQSAAELAENLNAALEKVTLDKVPSFSLRESPSRKLLPLVSMLFLAGLGVVLVLAFFVRAKPAHFVELSKSLDKIIDEKKNTAVPAIVEELLADDSFKGLSREAKIKCLDKYFEKLTEPENGTQRLIVANQLLDQLVRLSGDLQNPEPDSKWLSRVKKSSAYILAHEKSAKRWKQLDWMIDQESNSRNRIAYTKRAGQFLLEIVAVSNLRNSTSGPKEDEIGRAISAYINAAQRALDNDDPGNYYRLMKEAEILSSKYDNRECQHYHTVRAEEYLWKRQLDKAANELEISKNLSHGFLIAKNETDQRQKAEAKLKALKDGKVPEDETGATANIAKASWAKWGLKQDGNKTP